MGDTGKTGDLGVYAGAAGSRPGAADCMMFWRVNNRH